MSLSVSDGKIIRRDGISIDRFSGIVGRR
jgi:hypothetical protein